MMKLLSLLLVMMAQLHILPAAMANPYPVMDAQSYILDKFSGHDIVFTGTVHQQPRILHMTAELLPRLIEHGVTHLALEITSDQQVLIDRFLQTGMGLEHLQLHKAIDCPDYRELFRVLQGLDTAKRPRVLAIDLPIAQYSGMMSRNEYMAHRLASIMEARPDAKILSILGGSHVLRKLRWRNRHFKGQSAIRTYLEQWRPGLRMVSLVHVVDQLNSECDFSRRLAPIGGTVGFDLDHRFKGWRLGLTDCMALVPSQPYELVDGVIVH